MTTANACRLDRTWEKPCRPSTAGGANKDDVVIAVEALKSEGDGDTHLVGSTKLARTLVENDLVDGYRLMIDPVILGGGKSIFFDDGALRKLRLVDDQVTTTGAILATYARTTG